MGIDFKITNPYNYSGYGSTLDYVDGIDENVSFKRNSGIKVYNEILNQIGIDHIIMNGLLNIITKNKHFNFTFIRANNDFQILYFKDDFGHLTPIPLKKIIETRNSIVNS